MNDEVPVLTKPQECFACVLKTEILDLGFIEKPKSKFLPFILKVCTIAGVTDNKKAEIQTLAVFITA